MMSAFFYGYMVLQIPGGWLAGKFGGKRVLGLGVLITALATVLMPTAARWDYRAVYVLRALMGLAEVKMFEVGEGVGNDCVYCSHAKEV